MRLFLAIGGCTKIHISSAGFSSVTEQTRVSHLAGQIDPYSMFLASLIYTELERTIIQSQVPGPGIPDHSHVAQHSVGWLSDRRRDYAPKE